MAIGALCAIKTIGTREGNVDETAPEVNPSTGTEINPPAPGNPLAAEARSVAEPPHARPKLDFWPLVAIRRGSTPAQGGYDLRLRSNEVSARFGPVRSAKGPIDGANPQLSHVIGVQVDGIQIGIGAKTLERIIDSVPFHLVSGGDLPVESQRVLGPIKVGHSMRGVGRMKSNWAIR